MPNSTGWAERLQAAWLQKGPLARGLWPISLVYAGLVGARQMAYRLGWLRTVRLPVRVLVVGNLVVGGAGKTPTTLALIGWLRDRGFTPGVISRGYGRRNQEVVLVNPHTPATDSGDEPLLLHLRAQVPVAVSADRIASAQALLAQHPRINVLISDDGLQHTRLERDVQIMVFDERGMGNGWLLPAGPLRAPPPNTPPPRTVVVYNATQATTPWPGFLIQRQLTGLTPLRAWWQGDRTQAMAVQAFAGQHVWAAAGLARPQRFFNMLREAGLQVQACPLPDHDAFAQLPWPIDAPCVMVTEKDAVKLHPERQGTARVWVARLAFEFPPAFTPALEALLVSTPNDALR